MTTGVDPFLGCSSDPLGPAVHAAAVTPSDTNELPNYSKRLWVGGVGNLTLITVGGETVTYPSVPAGTYIEARAKQVKATGTSAINILAEY